jgi:hypothetical protein
MHDLARLREMVDSNPGQALALADEDGRKNPHGLLQQERESIAIRALVRLARLTEARARAARFLSRYPGGPYSTQVRRLTGLSPDDASPVASPSASAGGHAL